MRSLESAVTSAHLSPQIAASVRDVMRVFQRIFGRRKRKKVFSPTWEWERTCRLSEEEVEKAFEQPCTLHRYGFSPVCIRMWTLRDPASTNRFGHGGSALRHQHQHIGRVKRRESPQVRGKREPRSVGQNEGNGGRGHGGKRCSFDCRQGASPRA